MGVSFVTAAHVSSSLAVAQVYLSHRAEDLANFEKGLVFKPDDRDVYLQFDNGYRAFLFPDGQVLLMDPDVHGSRFSTYQQFAAYYLAKFW